MQQMAKHWDWLRSSSKSSKERHSCSMCSALTLATGSTLHRFSGHWSNRSSSSLLQI